MTDGQSGCPNRRERLLLHRCIGLETASEQRVESKVRAISVDVEEAIRLDEFAIVVLIAC